MDLSILIPVYNAEKTLDGTLSSLLSQERADSFLWEVVAVDDGSSDGSLAVLAQMKQRFEEKGIPFSLFSGPNQGVANTRNRALEEAKGEYLLFLDADDRLFPDALCRLMETARQKNLSLLLFDALYLFRDGTCAPCPLSRHEGGEMSVRDYMLSEPAPWNKLIKKSLFCENGLRFCPGIWYEDLSVIPALAQKLSLGKIYYLKTPLYYYYQSENSITRSAYSPRRLDVFPALLHLKQSAPAHATEVEYLAFYHLYHSFMWIFWEAGQTDAIRRTNAFMNQHFPHWKKNPLIRSRHSRKERAVMALFYGEHFSLLRLWKGPKS
jgi:glycosyltransferase involved in cell wall biosynthesis